MLKLLLMSSSRTENKEYLAHIKEELHDFWGERKQVAFVPYAGVTIEWDAYTELVRKALTPFGFQVTGVHEVSDAVALVQEAEGIIVGGGNTFHLVHYLYKLGLMEVIRTEVMNGKPYMGWSAGANVACPTLGTTNDMPIIEPQQFETLQLIPFQINPHYTEAQLPNHNGETRPDRLKEYIEANPNVYVVGLPEGAFLIVQDQKIQLYGKQEITVFKKGTTIRTYLPSDNLQFLLTT